MSIGARHLQVVNAAHDLVAALNTRAAKDWLAVVYRRYLYGGWRHEDGRWIDKPHTIGMALHEACKALFCPVCTKCNCAPRNCKCQSPSPCWAYLGQIGKDEGDAFPCPVAAGHGSIPVREALLRGTVALFPGNQSGKTSSCASEFCSWPMGRRPWDDTLTAPSRPGNEGRIWGIACKSLTNSALTVIGPYVEQRLGDRIEKRIESSNGAMAGWELRDPPGDIIKIMSYEQYKNAGVQGVNPYEGPRFFAFWWDEPMPPGARSAVARGLVRARSAGWGRELISATPIFSSYLFEAVQDRAWNLGGDNPDVHVIGGTIHENPSLTPIAINQIMESWSDSEREARETGIFLHLANRVFPQFSEESHVYDDALHNVLHDKERDEPTSWPICQIVDPHTRRPWRVLWVAISPDETRHVIREWPPDRGGASRACTMTFDGYAKLFDQIESGFSGGRARVIWRVMDPNFGKTAAAGSGYDTVAKAMRVRGYHYRTDADNDIEQGHQAIRQRLAFDTTRPQSELNRPQLLVAQSCRVTIWSFQNYVHDDWADPDRAAREKPKEIGKDTIDCLRYFEACNFRYHDWRQRGDWYEAQKRRAAQRNWTT